LRATITAPEDGYLSRADALTLGRAAMAMGAGRVRKEDSIDLSCGIVLAKSIGDRVHAGDTLATLYASSQRLLDEGCRMARHAFAVSLEPVDSPVLIHRL
jgi:pyrimidine-nucleoside phosphorylase